MNYTTIQSQITKDYIKNNVRCWKYAKIDDDYIFVNPDGFFA